MKKTKKKETYSGMVLSNELSAHRGDSTKIQWRRVSNIEFDKTPDGFKPYQYGEIAFINAKGFWPIGAKIKLTIELVEE